MKIGTKVIHKDITGMIVTHGIVTDIEEVPCCAEFECTTIEMAVIEGTEVVSMHIQKDVTMEISEKAVEIFVPASELEVV